MPDPPATQSPRRSTDSSPEERRAAILRRGRSVMAAEAAAIGDAQQRLGEAFGEAVDALIDSRGRVCVTGIGKARIIGDKIAATFASTGTAAYSLHAVEALHGDLGMVRPDDVVIALSKSGGSEILALLPLLAQRGCRIILITGDRESPAAHHAHFVLDIGDRPEACPLGLAPSSSTTAMLALGDALALTVMELREIEPCDVARDHPGGALGRSLMRAASIMRSGEDVPVVSESATLGACYAAILKAPRRAGAALVVDAAGRLVGILTHGDFFRLFQEREGVLDLPVSQVMTRNPKRVRSDDLVLAALDVMRQHAIDEIVVVDDSERVAGLIDIQDLVARGYSIFEPR